MSKDIDQRQSNPYAPLMVSRQKHAKSTWIGSGILSLLLTMVLLNIFYGHGAQYGQCEEADKIKIDLQSIEDDLREDSTIKDPKPASDQSHDPQKARYCDGHYLLAPSINRGVLFDFAAPMFKDFEKAQSKDRKDNVLKGYVDSIETDSHSFPLDLKSRTPRSHEENESLKGSISKEEIKLKKQKAMTDSQKRRLLVLRDVRYHGTTGILLVSYLMGGWTVHTVLKGTPAEKYGLRAGDVIDSVDGENIRGMPIERVYFRITGRRGQQKFYNIRRNGVAKRINIPLWSIYDIKDRRSQYIEYYWYLLYHKAITLNQYHRLVKPFIYFEEPVLRVPIPVRKSR